jgi:hypothetical protein
MHHVYAYSPDSAPPPRLQLAHLCTMSTHDEYVGMGGCLASASYSLRWGGGGLKSAVFTGDTADYKMKVLSVYINLPCAAEVAIQARRTKLSSVSDVRRGPITC